MLSDTAHTYLYDAENRIVQVDNGISYLYDAEGRRVGKSDGTRYLVGLSGEVLDELNGSVWRRSEVYAGSRHLATVTPQGTFFTHADWLGGQCRSRPLRHLGQSAADPELATVIPLRFLPGQVRRNGEA